MPSIPSRRLFLETAAPAAGVTITVLPQSRHGDVGTFRHDHRAGGTLSE
jgi:hypothetical protein